MAICSDGIDLYILSSCANRLPASFNIVVIELLISDITGAGFVLFLSRVRYFVAKLSHALINDGTDNLHRF